MTTRREVLRIGAWTAMSAAAPHALARRAAARTLLILGGTGFIGPHLTQEALRLDWKVTHFNRGKSAPGGMPGVETLIGDRNGQLDALRGRKWDAVIDDTGYIPRFVRMSAEMLAPNVGYCLYISSISAYASFAKPNDESSPTGKLTDPEADKVTEDTYGPMKALCEVYSTQAFKGRVSIVRPGYIVGPLDPTGRLTYWPVRASRGGEMLAPGTPHDPIQVMDVRDLAQWMMKLVASRTNGYFNAISPPARPHHGPTHRGKSQCEPRCRHHGNLGSGGFSGRALEARRALPDAVGAHQRQLCRRRAHGNDASRTDGPAVPAAGADDPRYARVVQDA